MDMKIYPTQNANSLDNAKFRTGYTLNVFDDEQVTITNDATGDVMVNLVAHATGYGIIYLHPHMSELVAISLVVQKLIQENSDLIHQLQDTMTYSDL